GDQDAVAAIGQGHAVLDRRVGGGAETHARIRAGLAVADFAARGDLDAVAAVGAGQTSAHRAFQSSIDSIHRIRDDGAIRNDAADAGREHESHRNDNPVGPVARRVALREADVLEATETVSAVVVRRAAGDGAGWTRFDADGRVAAGGATRDRA